MNWRPGQNAASARDCQAAGSSRSDMRHGTYRRVEATHVIHLAEPRQFTDIIEEFLR